MLLTTPRSMLTNKNPESFADITDRKKYLKSPHAKKLLKLMPADIKKKLVKLYLNADLATIIAGVDEDLVSVQNWFQENSVIRQIVNEDPSSSKTFEYLYRAKPCGCSVDEFFPAGNAATRIYHRLQAIIAYKVKLYTRMLETRDHLYILSLCSGPNYGCIEAIRQLPVKLQERITLTNVDIDKWVIDRGREYVAGLDIKAKVEYIQGDIRDINSLGIKTNFYDVVDFVGVVCTAPYTKKIGAFFLCNCFINDNGVIMPSIPMHKMIYDDPLTDFIMRITGWHMVYETIVSIHDVAEEAGLKWDETYEGLRAYFTDKELDEIPADQKITKDTIVGDHIMPLLTKI